MTINERIQSILENAEKISSGDPLPGIETPFRILAGPGAGKTHWLVEHIKQVIERSDMLGPGQRIACISYTTVAAEEIKSRLGSAVTHVDVSTIHSFLYRNIVKPYLYWVKDENGEPEVDYRNVDGHRPHEPIIPLINRWLDRVSEMNGIWRFDDQDEVLKYLRKLRWEWNSQEKEWTLADRGYPPAKYFPSSESNLKLYKKIYWEEGVIDHEDVLYFALRILNENLRLSNFIAARHPYIFVDEFQDTNPIQTEILDKLSRAGSVTGVIGDVEQSIFEFAGANPHDLVDFAPPDQKTYHITKNRRSTKEIVSLLNHVRQGSNQDIDPVEGTGSKIQPVVLVGEPVRVRTYVLEQDRHARTLTRRNALVRLLAGSELLDEEYDNAWTDLLAYKPDRAEWLQHILEAIHEARDGSRYGHAVKIIYRGMRTKGGRLLSSVFTSSGDRQLERNVRRKVAASLLPHLLTKHDLHLQMSGFEFYHDVRDRMEVILPNTPMVEPTRGTFVDRLKETSFQMLYATARLESGKGSVKTIHKAKGEEYHTVLVYRGSKEEKSDPVIEHLLRPDESDAEERRVTYVGLSRAKKQLFIGVDQLGVDQEAQIKELGLRVKRLGS